MVVLSALRGDSAAAVVEVADEILGAGVDLDLKTFLDHAALEVPAGGSGRPAGKDEEEELEWLSNKDAFPAAPGPPTNGAGRPRRAVVKKAAARRCRHCGTEETPQWREGPEGRAMLCNACGIQYWSGHLVPEYRPASSPTFSRELHSNSHRNIVKMRRLREEAAMAMAFPPSPPQPATSESKQG